MLTRKFLPLVAVLAMASIGATANANIIAFGAPSQAAIAGDEVSFDINMDFLSSTVGGSFDIFYDASLLSYVGFEFNADFLANVADPDFAIMPDNCLADGAAISGCGPGDAELNGIGFGSFDGISGMHTIGTVTFETLDAGLAVLMMATNDSPWEGFFSAVDASELVVLYGPGKVQIAPIPLPAAVWLMLSGIGLLGGFAGRRR